MQYFYAILLTICFNADVLFAQTPDLKDALAKAGLAFKNERYQESETLAENAYALAKKSAVLEDLSEAEFAVAKAATMLRKYDLSKEFYEKAIEGFEKTGRPVRLAYTLVEYTRDMYRQENYLAASRLVLKAQTVYNEQISPADAAQNIELKIIILDRMAIVLDGQKQFDEGERYALEAYELAERNNGESLLDACNVLGNIYASAYNPKKDFDKAGFYFEAGLQICRRNNRNAAKLLNNLGISYARRKIPNYDKAIECYQAAIEENKKIGAQESIARNYVNMAYTYNYKKDFINSVEYSQKAIAILSKTSANGLLEAYGELVKGQEGLKDYLKALEAQKAYAIVQDSMFYKNRQKDLAEFQTKFAVAKKDYDITNLQNDRRLGDIQLQQQTLALANQQLIQEKNQQKIVDLQRDKLLQDLEIERGQADLAQQTQLSEKSASQLALADQARQLQIQETATQKQKALFFKWMVLGLLVIGGLLLALLRYRGKIEKERTELERKRLEEEKEFTLRQSELKALRSQMNPHFIFNVLNSINNFMLDNDAENASFYLTKFARLMRQVLENSRTERVTLENELKALELYIQLEALRFKDKIKYLLCVDPSIDKKYIKIPPLLVQPYVENAIWHGLMHRLEGGTISIHASEPQENLLRIEISDDGVGRAAAAAFKSKSAAQNKSFGMDITSERLKLANESFQRESQITVHDLLYADGSPAGTQVILEIPY